MSNSYRAKHYLCQQVVHVYIACMKQQGIKAEAKVSQMTIRSKHSFCFGILSLSLSISLSLIVFWGKMEQSEQDMEKTIDQMYVSLHPVAAPSSWR